VQDHFGGAVETTYKENLPEGPEVAQTIEDLIADGNTVIFGTSFGFQEAFVTAAAAHPDVCFEFATGYMTSTNMAQFYGAAEDTDYLAGMAAGAASKTGKLGYLASFPIPEVVRGANAWTMGVRAMNPEATVKVVWLNTWFDPAKEKEAAESLLATGADVLAMHQDTTATGEAAKEAGAKWVGYNSDTEAGSFPDTWLTGPVWNWGPHYVKLGKDIAAGTCDNTPYYGTMADGMITLGVFGSSVDQATKDLINERASEIISGSLQPFTGPIKDNEGNEQIAAGATAALGDLLGQSYLVEGVIGSAKG